MQQPIVNEQERHVLQALLTKGPMPSAQLNELCKNAFGWSGAVIRRTQKSLLKQGLVTVQEGLLTPTVTKEDLEDNNWNQWVGGTFEWTPPPRREQKAKPFFKSVWFWSTCVACAVIGVLCVLLVIGPPTADTVIPDELQICKEALDKWQANENYYVLQDTKIWSQEKHSEDPHFYMHYYIHENDWAYLVQDINNLTSTEYPNYMYRDGQLFLSHSILVGNWLTWGEDPIPTPTPWPMTFSWKNCELLHHDTVTTANHTLIRFRLIDNSKEVPEIYEMEFTFDDLQNLTKIQMTTTQTASIARCDIFTLESTDPKQIATVIEGLDQEAEPDIFDTVPPA